jgi:ERCC4-type nuclease
MKKVVENGKLVAPFTLVIDSREQTPYAFAGLRSDADAGRRPLLVRTVTRGLEAGDYSLEGFERLVAVERKSLSDLFATLGQARARFVRELRRLQALYEFAAVVVEAGWEDILVRPPPRSRLRPKTVFRSVVAWQQRYPRVHWWMCPSREFAEVVTFRMLERFWRDRTAKDRGKEPPY